MRSEIKYGSRLKAIIFLLAYMHTVIGLDLAARSPEILTLAGKEQHFANKYK